MKKILSVGLRGLKELTDVRFILGVLTGSGVIAIALGNAVGLF